MRVTVVTPNYNGAKTIEDTIISVLSQDYPDLEYIVVDDGSTDNSITIINKYSDSLKLIEKSNGGLPTAINAGFQRASGDLVCWLDSDNLLLPDALRIAAEAFSAHPEASIVYGDYIKINERGVPISLRKQPSFDYNICLYGYLTISNAAVFFNHRHLECIGYADETLHSACDMDLFLRLTKLGPAIHICDYLGAYRIHSNSMSIVHSDRLSKETLSVRLKHGNPKMKSYIMRFTCLWYKFRAAVRMLLEGAIWCRIWPIDKWLLPTTLPVPKSRTPGTVVADGN